MEIHDISPLDPAMQADRLVAPVVKWGSSLSRKGTHEGTYHFYADDYKFHMLLRRPMMLPATGCGAAVEPNFSLTPGMPASEALYWTACKRALGRLWQSVGVRLLVDLNVDPAFRDLNLAGVPGGWTSYATRSHAGVPFSEIEADFATARDHAGLAAGLRPILFCVFGGGKALGLECRRRGWEHVPEHRHVAEGRVAGYGQG